MKRILEDINEGYANPFVTGDRCVCEDCFEEAGIKSFIRDNATEANCDFCGRSSSHPIATDLKEVLDHIVDCMSLEWDNPNDAGVPYESREGGWQAVSVYDRWDAFESAGVWVSDSSGDLWNTMMSALDDREFCDRNPFRLSEDRRLIGGWATLAERLKHETRFFFTREEEDDEYVSPSELLDRLGDEVAELGLVTTLAAGSRVYRVRYQAPGKHYTSAADLGPPPVEKATISNRMSPPGIVMTYAAEDPDTALAETQSGPGTFVVSTFELLRDIELIELSAIPPVPSLFDADRNLYRSVLSFLHEFAADISKPIARDDRVHVEYIPTQVVTEYFRVAFSAKHFPVHGIRYTSAPRPTHASVVLFADQRDVEGTEAREESGKEPMLRLIDRSEVVVA